MLVGVGGSSSCKFSSICLSWEHNLKWYLFSLYKYSSGKQISRLVVVEVDFTLIVQF